MQIKSLRLKSYRSWAVNDRASVEALARLQKLEWYEKLRQEGCSSSTRLEIIGWSRATYYRWLKRYRRGGMGRLESRSRGPRRRRSPTWSRQQEQQVLHLRQRFPLWGKRKLWRVLVRDHGWTLSESTVGRIVTALMRRGRIKPVAFYYGRVKPKRRRAFQRHAKRWRYGMKGRQPGELVQLDHMSLSFPQGKTLKEFKAVCPVTKWCVLRVYSRATSRTARHFLQYLIQQMPFPIRSIQVDGGSEFMAEFEQACQDLNLPLFVLPPKKPEYNGCVERANGASRYEFYPFYRGPLTLNAIHRELTQYQSYYNSYRPHDGMLRANRLVRFYSK